MRKDQWGTELFFCPECMDVHAIWNKRRVCHCGQSAAVRKGRRGVLLVLEGQAALVEFGKLDFEEALVSSRRVHPLEKYMAHRFEAFIITGSERKSRIVRQLLAVEEKETKAKKKTR